ncbi:hypothetical protein NPX13_g2783 [Xylaria arbuscula]|uniref:T6SS Phospholipase effector Tle1-like catalytic domain-containing protein n=1 Tax=Xylaria arbuscula TaxID=114810 RepID=A0A9W8NJR0_9PEZI|nr:hypothetical protein NPX13_g2783 [Xylaria arbuscula]
MPSSPMKPIIQAVRKRLFIFCDGTWQDSVNKARPLTNVATLARCLDNVAEDGYLQVSYYDNGVGDRYNPLDNVIDGATGRGISAKIRNAYTFLSHNYNFEHKDDEIILVGFSRGAFAVQCLASFISQTGLLNKHCLYYLRGLFTIWANQHLPTARDMLAKYVKMLSRPIGVYDGEPLVSEKVLMKKVQIKACVVWDTVSSLGYRFTRLRPFSSVGSVIPAAVDHALHILAVDEHRSQFNPQIWIRKEKPETAVKQCWFLGSHSDVGGNGDAALGAITLIWVVGQLQKISRTNFNQDEIKRHLRHRCLNWDVKTTFCGRRLKQNLAFSRLSSSGYATKSSPLWWLLGHTPRRLENAIRHQDPRLDIETFIHYTVRLSMIQDPTVCQRLRKWHTKEHNGSISWVHNSKKLPEEKIDGDETFETTILRIWSMDDLPKIGTDRSRFATELHAIVHDLREESHNGFGRFAPALHRGLIFENGCLSLGSMYNTN